MVSESDRGNRPRGAEIRQLTPDRLVQELVPDLHHKQFYKRIATPMYFKTHHLPRPEYRRVVYLVRDGRDTLVSNYHHARALVGTSVDFGEMVREGRYLFPCRWHEHVEQWLENPFGAAMMTIRYEDLRRAPALELQRFCDFVGLKRKSAFLQKVADAASFENARRKEIAQGWDNPAWPKDRFFVRRGVVGSFKDEMPTALLHDFLARSQASLARLDYC